MFDTVKEWLSSPDLAKDVTLQLMAAQIYLANGRLKEGQTNTQCRQRGRIVRAAATENCVAAWSSHSLLICMPPRFLLDSAVSRRQRR